MNKSYLIPNAIILTVVGALFWFLIWVMAGCESTTRYIIEEELDHCTSRECCQERCGEDATWHPIRGCESCDEEEE